MSDARDAEMADWLDAQPRRRPRITPAEAAAIAEETIAETRAQIASIVALADELAGRL